MKEMLGFKTQKILKETIKGIIHKYNLEQEFFHPLIQELFLQYPYWCEPPGIKFTKFKWSKQKLPNGKFTEKWFMCFSEEFGWQSRSLNKCIADKPMKLERKLKLFARQKIMSIITDYRTQNPVCEFNNCKKLAVDVHHVVPIREILKQIILESNIIEEYDEDFDPYKLSNDSLFVKLLFDRHKIPGSLMSLCKSHHYEIEGRKEKENLQFNSVIEFLQNGKLKSF